MRLCWMRNNNESKLMISLMQQSLTLAFVLAFTLDNQATFVSGDPQHDEVANLPHHNDLTHDAVEVEESLDRQRRSAGANGTPLGKRITSNLIAELGKRPRELYSFGIGKRSISPREMAEFLAEQEGVEGGKAASENSKAEVGGGDQMELHQLEDGGADGSHRMIYKRDPYAFGLGKRTSDAAFPEPNKREYGFGLGRKRDPYAFGLGKRDPYSFGLGKRDPYAFGLGKRDPYAFGLGKRTPYSFGLGKRDPYSFGLGKRDPYSFGLGKRSEQ